MSIEIPPNIVTASGDTLRPLQLAEDVQGGTPFSLQQPGKYCIFKSLSTLLQKAVIPSHLKFKVTQITPHLYKW